MILGLDPGERRIGAAIADRETRLALPLEVIDVQSGDVVQAVARIAEERAVDLVVVGRPLGLAGGAGPAVEAQQRLVARLRRGLGVPIEEYDERLTTVVAEQGLRAAGGKASARKAIRDAVAAQVMLQGYLDSRPR